jgi:exodeoxyribonuclease V gamma subunit
VFGRFEEDEPADSLTVELDALQQWVLGERVLRARLAGTDEADCRQAEWRRGVLPPGPLGRSALDVVLAEVGPLVDRTAALLSPPRRVVDVVVPLGGGRELRGTVAGVHGTAAVSVGYSKLGPKPQLTAWISLLALAAAAPERSWTAVAVGRGEPSRPRSATFGPLDQATAQRHLLELVDLFDRGRREPLPLPLKASLAYATSAAKMEGPDLAQAQAARNWTSGKFPGEDADAAHALVWGSAAPFSAVSTSPAAPGEQWLGEPTRFGELSLRLWAPLLQHRRLVSL